MDSGVNGTSGVNYASDPSTDSPTPQSGVSSALSEVFQRLLGSFGIQSTGSVTDLQSALELQMQLQRESIMFNSISNSLKTRFETQLNIVRNEK